MAQSEAAVIVASKVLYKGVFPLKPTIPKLKLKCFTPAKMFSGPSLTLLSRIPNLSGTQALPLHLPKRQLNPTI